MLSLSMGVTNSEMWLDSDQCNEQIPYFVFMATIISTVLLALSRADAYISRVSLPAMGRWGHSSAPTKITPLMYVVYGFTIFIPYLVREAERNLQGGVMCNEG